RQRGTRLTEAELEDESVVQAVHAVDHADATGDTTEVVDLIRTAQLSSRARNIIADWIERRTQRSGRPRTPSHEVSEKEFRLLQAEKEVEHRVSRGVKRGEAIRNVAQTKNISEKSLRNFVSGKRGSTRRLERRP